MKTWWPIMDPQTLEGGYVIYDSATTVKTKHSGTFGGRWHYDVMQGYPIRVIE